MSLLQQAKNLYLPGEMADGNPRTLIDLPAINFWGKQSVNKGAAGDAYGPELLGTFKDKLGIGTLVVLDQLDHSLGKPRIAQRIITSNVVTDNGAIALLKLFTATAGTVAQYMVLDQAASGNGQYATCAAQLSGSISAAADLTTLNTNNGPAINAAGSGVSAGNYTALATGQNKASSFASNTTNTPCTSGSVGSPDTSTDGGITLGYGLGTVEYFSGSATQSNALNIKASAGVAKNAHNANEWVVSRAQTGDGGTWAANTTSIIYNSSASTNAATGTAIANSAPSGTGKGGHSVVYSNILFNTSSTAGYYAGLWIAAYTSTFTVAASTAAANQYTHLTFSSLQIGANNSITVSYTISI